jgi:3',5'-cyclic AMP phosphodiesterase CpdA
MKIIHLSDTHILDDRNKTLKGINPAINLEKALQSIEKNHNDAEFIVITGDLVESPSKKAYEIFYEIIKKSTIPVYPLIGNHDDRELFLKFFPAFQSDRFAQYFFVTDNLAFVFLDTNVKNQIFGKLCDKRLEWLENILQKNRDKNLFIFMHHHPIEVGMYKMDNEYDLKNKNEFFNLINKFNNVKHISFGHVHRIIQVYKNSISLNSTRALVSSIVYNPKLKEEYFTNEEKPTYAVLNILKDTLLIHYCEFLNEERIFS